MITSVSIHNFQSLTDVQLDLAPLTVIVGPSSSGKSAFIRALTALIRNRRGTEFITHGERTASISATLPSGIVTLTRSSQTAPNHYTLIRTTPDPTQAHQKQEFSKLGGDVPEPISLFLGIPTSQAPITIASQFDPPYLLSAPATEAARIFGSLTNASVLLDAARESNRRKLASSQLLKTRAQDLDQIRLRIPEFRQIQAQSQALSQADTLITQARTLTNKLSTLTHHTETIQIAQTSLQALHDRLSHLPSPDALASLEHSLTALTAAHSAISTYQSTLTTLQTALQARNRAHTALATAQTSVTTATLALAQSMAGIAQGFETHFRAHSKTLDPENRLDAHEAAQLAAEYVSGLDS